MKTIKKIIYIVLMAAIGGIFGFGIATYSISWLAPIVESSGIVAFISYPILAFALALLVHELGHVVGGALRKFEFQMLTVLVFKVQKVEEQLKFSLNTNLNTWGGLALMVPRGAFNRSDYMWFVAGGPFSSFASMVLSVLLIRSDAFPSPMMLFLGIFALVSAIIFITSAVPLPIDKDFDNDGSQFMDLARGGTTAIRKIGLMRLVAQSVNGLDPAEFDIQLIQELKGNGSPDKTAILATYYELGYHQNRGDWKSAHRVMGFILDHIDLLPEFIHKGVYQDAMLTSTLFGDREKALEYFEKSMIKGYSEQAKDKAVLAAKALMDDDKDAWDSFAHEARLLSPKMLDKSAAKLLRMILDELDNSMKKQHGQRGIDS